MQNNKDKQKIKKSKFLLRIILSFLIIIIIIGFILSMIYTETIIEYFSKEKEVIVKEKLTKQEEQAIKEEINPAVDFDPNEKWIKKYEALSKKARLTNNINEKIDLCHKMLKVPHIFIMNNWSPMGSSHAYDVVEIIKLYLKKYPKITLNELMKYIQNDIPYKIIEIDLDGDGINEKYIPMESVVLFLEEISKKVNLLVVEECWRMEVVRNYDVKGTNKKCVLIHTEGANGKGCSKYMLVGIQGGELKIVFETPYGISELNNKDGKDEIICNSWVDYASGITWPSIFRWNGETFSDVSLEYPDLLIKKYKEIYKNAIWYGNNPEYYLKKVESINKMLLLRSKEHAEFWKKNLKPIKDAVIEEINKTKQ